MSCGFVHERVIGDCACCGMECLRLQTETGTTAWLDIDYHRVHFRIDPPELGLLPITLCSVCVTHTFTPELMVALEAQCIAGWKTPPAQFKVLQYIPWQSWSDVQ